MCDGNLCPFSLLFPWSLMRRGAWVFPYHPGLNLFWGHTHFSHHSLWLHSSCATQFHFFDFPQKSRCLRVQYISLKTQHTVRDGSITPWRPQTQTPHSPALTESLGYFYLLGSCHVYWLSPFLFFLLCSTPLPILVYFLCWANDSVSSNPYLPRSHFLLLLHINSLIDSTRIK